MDARTRHETEDASRRLTAIFPLTNATGRAFRHSDHVTVPGEGGTPDPYPHERGRYGARAP
jgi:hypothetical protein